MNWLSITIESAKACGLETFGEALLNMHMHFPFSPAELVEYERQYQTWNIDLTTSIDEAYPDYSPPF